VLRLDEDKTAKHEVKL